MKRLIFFCSILLLLCSGTVSDIKPFDFEIWQDGSKIKIENGQINLKKKTFNLLVFLNNTSGIYLNASFTKDYFNLDNAEQVKDLQYIRYKVFAEYKFNEQKELYIHPESFHFFGYHTGDEWHKFNDLQIDGAQIMGTRIIEKFINIETKEAIRIEDMERDIYLFFLLTTDYKKDPSVKEIMRRKLHITWDNTS